MATVLSLFFFFFFNDTATTEIYTLSLHDALPICCDVGTVLAQTGEVGGGSMTGIDEGHERLRVDSGAQHRDEIVRREPEVLRKLGGGTIGHEVDHPLFFRCPVA